MKFSYEINALNSSKTKKGFIEAADIQQALSRIKNIMFSGVTGSFQVGYFEKTNNFIKGEVWKERPREKPTKEYSFIIKALSKTQDSGSRVFDRLFKVLNKAKTQDSVKGLNRVTGLPKVSEKEKNDFYKPYPINRGNLAKHFENFLKSGKNTETIQSGRGLPTDYTITLIKAQNGELKVIWRGHGKTITAQSKGIKQGINEYVFAEKVAHKINTLNKFAKRTEYSFHKTPKIGDEAKATYSFVLLMKYPNEVRNSTIEFKAKDIKEARQFLKNHFDRIGGYKITKFTNDKLYLKGEAGNFIDITYSAVKKIGDDLVKGLDNKPLRTKYTISYDAYYTAGVKLNNGKYSRSETEKRATEVIATSKQEALQKLKNGLKKAERVGYRYSNFKIIKIEREPVYEKLSEQEKLKLLLGERI